jgi:hypothetical protein
MLGRFFCENVGEFLTLELDERSHANSNSCPKSPLATMNNADNALPRRIPTLIYPSVSLLDSQSPKNSKQKYPKSFASNNLTAFSLVNH